MLTLTQPADRGATEFIPAADIVAGHVIDFFGEQHRVDRFQVEQRGPIFDPERFPPRRVAVAIDGFELTLVPGQKVPVVVPTRLYTIEVYRTATPAAPVEAVPFAAETAEMAGTIARRILVLMDAAWGDIHSGSDYVETVAVS